MSQWADGNRKLSSESSAEPGAWRTSRAEYQRGIMDALHEVGVFEIVVMKSSQVGWTEILNNCIGYYVHRTPAPILLLQPTLEMAEAWSKDRFAPMLRDTPALAGRVADARSRDSGNTLLHKRFPGGHITIVGANSPASLASRPIRILLCDEVDRFPESAGAEGDPIDLARRRTATFRNRKVLMGSTPTIKGSSRIEAAFEQSDQRYYFVPCPHCGEFQRLIWTQVKFKEVGLPPEQAVYQCSLCSELIDHTFKADMLRRGEWRPTKQSAGIAGFHISELYSPWSTWGEMAVAFVRARPLPETFKTWVNTALGETFEESADKLESAALVERRESYTDASLPPGALVLTMGTDVQDDRLESTVWAWGADEEAWRVGHYVLRGDPGGQALWDEHDDLMRRRFRTDDGRELLIESCCVDSGGHFTEQVYRYCLKRKKYRIWAIKGIAGPGRPGWPKKAGRGKAVAVALWMVGVDTIKSLIYGRLKKVISPGPGYIHFDANVDDDYFDQLTSEVVVTQMSQGRRIQKWKPKKLGTRQEGLDCMVYAYAALLGRGGTELLTARAKRFVPQDTNAAPVAPAVEEAPEFDAPRPEPSPARRPNRFRPRNWSRNWK